MDISSCFLLESVCIIKEGRKEGNVYLMMHSTHFIYRVYGIIHMVLSKTKKTHCHL